VRMSDRQCAAPAGRLHGVQRTRSALQSHIRHALRAGIAIRAPSDAAESQEIQFLLRLDPFCDDAANAYASPALST